MKTPEHAIIEHLDEQASASELATVLAVEAESAAKVKARSDPRQRALQIFALGTELDLVGALTARDLEEAMARNSLPLSQSVFDLLRPVCDPATISFPGNFDFNLCGVDTLLEMTRGKEPLDPSLQVMLLLAGLLKFMGCYGAADALYGKLPGWPELAGRADLIASAALFERHLKRDESAGVSVTANYGILPLLREALEWPSMSTPTLHAAAALVETAAAMAPDVAVCPYLKAVIHRHEGRFDAAETALADARRLVRPDGPADRYLALQLDRNSCVLEAVDG